MTWLVSSVFDITIETCREYVRQGNESLREKCLNTELLLVRIFLHQSEYRKIRNTNNSVFGHFSRSELHSISEDFLSEKDALQKWKDVNLTHTFNLFRVKDLTIQNKVTK